MKPKVHHQDLTGTGIRIVNQIDHFRLIHHCSFDYVIDLWYANGWLGFSLKFWNNLPEMK